MEYGGLVCYRGRVNVDHSMAFFSEILRAMRQDTILKAIINLSHRAQCLKDWNVPNKLRTGFRIWDQNDKN